MSVALYRKYRSQDFKELIGQQHVAQSLENALKAGRISHAYLFTGPRGVGKTSTARILAMRLNGVKTEDLANHLDIIEIDAASNRRIDEIRDLRDKVHLAPTNGKYKVYIIDEVHMLTTEAFNALLKTLEEPPEHAIFILATTEPHKLPETIISRTQRYSFRPIATPILADYLALIAKKEKIKITTPALELIAAAGEGSARDALSILDQVANLGSGQIDEAAVIELLGLGDQHTVEKLAVALLQQQPTAVLEVFDAYHKNGGAPAQLLQQLLRLLEQILRIQLGLGEAQSEQQVWLSSNTSSTTIAKILQRLTQIPQNSPYLEIALEATLVQIASLSVTKTAPTPMPAVKPEVVSEVKPVAASGISAKPKPVAKKQRVSAPAADSDFADTSWPKVLTRIKEHNNSLYALLRSADAELADDTVSVQFRFQFHRRRLDEAKNQQLLAKMLSEVMGKPIRVKTLVASAAAIPTGSEAEQQQDREAVDNVLQILGGEVVS